MSQCCLPRTAGKWVLIAVAFLVAGCSSSSEVAENDTNGELEVEPSSTIEFECANDQGVEGPDVLQLLFEFRERNRELFLQFPTVDVLCDVADAVCSDPLGIFASELDAFRSPADVPEGCLLYTSPSPRDLSTSRMPSSA